jgi:hypothetical protein
LAEVLDFARTYLDFYTGAYYTAAYTVVPPRDDLEPPTAHADGGHGFEQALGGKGEWKGINLEAFKDPDAMAREWAEFQDITAACNRAGAFVTLPGYEWQGNGRWGDHNVIYKAEGLPIYTVDALPDLYQRLRGLDAIAIPHHTGYCVGHRAPTWAVCDDRISPFAEIFSVHGCSETDEEWIGLRTSAHMGPGVGGGTYQDALDLGLHLGAVCSTDNWTNMPGRWGHGLMACLARDLTRESLWEAFLARRVYGVTGDRIQLEFTCNGAHMGSTVDYAPVREIRVCVRGSDALDRIEILRNGRVVATHCHQGTWDVPPPGARTRFKLRIEAGWGPLLGEIYLPDQRWKGHLSVGGGRMVAWEPCWITRGQGVPQLLGNEARFQMLSRQVHALRRTKGATLFEFEADPDAEVALRVNDLQARHPLRTFAAHSHLLWSEDASSRLIRAATGRELGGLTRRDVYYNLACKVKVHRAIPESAYTASMEFIDDKPLDHETHYRVRVEQRNAQRAWSSPIWVRAPA